MLARLRTRTHLRGSVPHSCKPTADHRFSKCMRVQVHPCMLLRGSSPRSCTLEVDRQFSKCTACLCTHLQRSAPRSCKPVVDHPFSRCTQAWLHPCTHLLGKSCILLGHRQLVRRETCQPTRLSSLDEDTPMMRCQKVVSYLLLTLICLDADL